VVGAIKAIDGIASWGLASAPRLRRNSEKFIFLNHQQPQPINDMIQEIHNAKSQKHPTVYGAVL
jgi:hypothetical protein